MEFNDRVEFDRLYKASKRADRLAIAGGLYLSLEIILRDQYFKKMAIGWKFCSVIGMTYAFKTGFNLYNGSKYRPIIGAYLRKYENKGTPDMWEMRDIKREFYEIDTS